MRTTWLCDFDGTAAPADIGKALVERFSAGDPARRAALLADWIAGRVGHRELTVAECATMRVTGAEAAAFARGFGLDPAFAGFVGAARAAGDRVMIVSEGFDFYIADQLARAGLSDLPWAANRARFEGDRMIPSFPYGTAPGEGGAGCGRCGNCKAQHVRAARAAGTTVALVGDGLSDRCAAAIADTVVARGSLLAWCRAQGVEAVPFEDFGDVADFASAGRSAPAPAPRRAASGGGS